MTTETYLLYKIYMFDCEVSETKILATDIDMLKNPHNYTNIAIQRYISDNRPNLTPQDMFNYFQAYRAYYIGDLVKPKFNPSTI